MQANEQEQAALQQAGFSFEHPDHWAKSVGDARVTIADGLGPNGYAWEVQVFEDGCCIAATEGFASVAQAITMADAECSA